MSVGVGDNSCKRTNRSNVSEGLVNKGIGVTEFRNLKMLGVGGYIISHDVLRASWYANNIFYQNSSSNQLKLTGLSPAKVNKLKFYSFLQGAFGLDAAPTLLWLITMYSMVRQ